MGRVFSNIDHPRGKQQVLPLNALERAFHRAELFQGQGLHLRRVGGDGLGRLPKLRARDPLHRLKPVLLLEFR